MIDEEIRTLDDNIHSHRVHGVLIARNGKLVLEEYFHGYDRNTPHDTRSASKSMASVLVGAAMLIRSGLEPRTACHAAIVEPPSDEPDTVAALRDAVDLMF